MNAQEMTSEPWFRNQWVWLIIAIPGCTVVGCMFTIWLAISHPDAIVKEATPASVPALRTPREALP